MERMQCMKAHVSVSVWMYISTRTPFCRRCLLLSCQTGISEVSILPPTDSSRLTGMDNTHTQD